MQDMHDTLCDLIDSSRSVRRADLFSALIEASESDESPLKPEELVGLCQLLLAGGNETTTNLLASAALVLQKRPDLLELVRTEPASFPAVGATRPSLSIPSPSPPRSRYFFSFYR